MYKAVFLDLDGTLLDEEKNISKENKDAIKYARSKGAYVCICTGRQIDIANGFKEEAGADRYLIFSNGAGIYDCEENQILYTSLVPKEIGYKLHNYVIQKGVFIRVDTKYGRYINDEKYKVNTEVVFKEEEAQYFYNENEVLQISIGSESEEIIDSISEEIKIKMGNLVKIENRYSLNLNGHTVWLINVINKSTSKGNAINGLCKYLKMDVNDVIACGDDLNDISMMKTVGLGIAMGNALDVVKNEAKEITKTNVENGVAYVLLNKF